MTAGLRRTWRAARRSLRARLVGLFLLLAAAMTLTFIGGMQAVMHYGWQELVQPLVADYADRLASDIGTPPDIGRAEALTRRLPIRIRIQGPSVNWSSQPDDHRHEARTGRPGDPARSSGRWPATRVLADGHRVTLGLAFLPRDDAPEDRARMISWATLLGMLLLLAIVYTRVRKLLAPLAEIRAGAIRYGAGDFSRQIPHRTHDELGELATQVNGMADGLHRMLDAKQQLLLAISHELRSPLTRARLNAELVEDGAPRDDLLHDLAEMRDLITDLLESERLTTGHAELHTEAVDLNELVRETVRAQFHDRSIRLALDPGLPSFVLDPVRVRLLLRNLLDNALQHSPQDAAPPIVRTAADHDAIRLSVRDHGPGVDPAQLPLLAQAFYRPDSARSRSSGGVGLGLYLCRLVALAHGGTLEMRNASPGLEVELRLPRAIA